MTGRGVTPKYAVRLVIVFFIAGIVFFGGLQLFVPEGSRLTGSYDAKSLRYIASAPLSYAGSESCGSSNCHSNVYQRWSEGSHGARDEKSKCEVCHGPQGNHPAAESKLKKVRGDGDVVALCLSCHQKLKARSTTGQPQITPSEHPYPHMDVLNCLQCHDPHSPAIQIKVTGAPTTASSQTDKAVSHTPEPAPKISENCAGCHGPAGRNGFAPVIAGLAVDDIRSKLMRFRTGELKGSMMNNVAAGLTDGDIETLAKYFSGQ